jgi:hypothetical protein
MSGTPMDSFELLWKKKTGLEPSVNRNRNPDPMGLLLAKKLKKVWLQNYSVIVLAQDFSPAELRH